MAWFLLESNRRFCAIFRRQVQKSCQETAGRLFIEGGVVVITNEKSASAQEFGRQLPPTAQITFPDRISLKTNIGVNRISLLVTLAIAGSNPQTARKQFSMSVLKRLCLDATLRVTDWRRSLLTIKANPAKSAIARLIVLAAGVIWCLRTRPADGNRIVAYPQPTRIPNDDSCQWIVIHCHLFVWNSAKHLGNLCTSSKSTASLDKVVSG